MLKPNKAGKKVGDNDFVSTTNSKKPEKNKPKKKNGKPNFFKKIGTKCKDVFSELKKVSWPSFLDVLKKTGVVLGVVVIFVVIITAFDSGLAALMGLLSK